MKGSKMGKWLTNKEDAIKIHSQFYSEKFEVIPVMHLGVFYSWFFLGPSSRLNCWDGYLSTDGKKIVITESGWMKMGMIKKQWILKPESIEIIRLKDNRIQLYTQEKLSGLTTLSFMEGSIFYTLSMLLFMIPALMVNRKLTKLRLSKDFENMDQIKRLIMKLNVRQSSQMTVNALTCNNCGYNGKMQEIIPRKDTGIRGEMRICPECGNTDK